MALIKINSSGTWQNTWGGVSESCSSCDGRCVGTCNDGCYGCNYYCYGGCNGCKSTCSGKCATSTVNRHTSCYGDGCKGSCSEGATYSALVGPSSYSVGTVTRSYSYTKINSSGTFKVPTNLRLNVSGTWKTLSK